LPAPQPTVVTTLNDFLKSRDWLWGSCREAGGASGNVYTGPASRDRRGLACYLGKSSRPPPLGLGQVLAQGFQVQLQAAPGILQKLVAPELVHVLGHDLAGGPDVPRQLLVS